ncbi:MAG TPA: hypothetical protein VIG37_20110, partial [Methylomirabilota bacterium]
RYAPGTLISASKRRGLSGHGGRLTSMYRQSFSLQRTKSLPRPLGERLRRSVMVTASDTTPQKVDFEGIGFTLGSFAERRLVSCGRGR